MNTVFYRGGLANDYVICAQPLWVLLLIHGISTTHRRSLGLLMVWWFVKIYCSLFQNANECRRKNWVIKPQGTACPCGISLDIGVWRIWSGLKRLRRAWFILLFVIIDYTLTEHKFLLYMRWDLGSVIVIIYFQISSSRSLWIVTFLFLWVALYTFS